MRAGDTMRHQGSFLLFAVLIVACGPPAVPDDPVTPSGEKDLAKDPDYEQLRQSLVKNQLTNRDITDPLVIRAMETVERHQFVDDKLKPYAYDDRPLPIGNGQTISQPYIVALMTQLVEPKPDSVALDVGTGSGYQAAVLAEIVDKVYSIEIVEPLAEQAGKRLKRLGYDNVEVRAGDGYKGWKEHAPFDIIILAAAPDHIPEPLIEQLAPGGKLILPVGRHRQLLTLVEKDTDGAVQTRTVAPVVFVPMTGPGVNR